MPRHPHRRDPFSKKTRDLDRKLRTVKAKIEQLSLEVDNGPAEKPKGTPAPDDPFTKAGPASNGEFRFPFESTLRPLFNRVAGLIKRPSPESERLVNYLAAGSFEGMRPLRFEKRVRRNRIIFFALINRHRDHRARQPDEFLVKSPAVIVAIRDIETDLGIFRASFTEAGLAGIEFPGRDRRGAKLEAGDHLELIATESALRDIFNGKKPTRLPRLDLSRGTDFQRAVWTTLTEIPIGRPVTYGELADRVGQPRGARAVGRACGANPIPVIVPCHRVIAADGGIGGFSGGLPWKIRLLEIEGFFLPNRSR